VRETNKTVEMALMREKVPKRMEAPVREKVPERMEAPVREKAPALTRENPTALIEPSILQSPVRSMCINKLSLYCIDGLFDLCIYIY
jgi:hypothetical protein